MLLFVFFRGIDDHGLLDPIEGINASVALNMLMRRDFSSPMVGGSPYLGGSLGFWWLSALSLSIFGWSEVSVRLWSALGGVGMAAAGWFIALRTGGERSANCAAVIISSSLVVYVTSQLASPHALYACCVTASLAGAVYAFRDRRFFILLHAGAALAFVVYGPAGCVLPWLSLLAYAVLAGQERFFAAALFYWPGLLVTALVGGGYVFFLRVTNPALLTLMLHNIPSETFGSASSALLFLAAGFLPWLGVMPGAFRSALPRRWGTILPSEKQNILLLAWASVFLFFGAFSGDAPLLAAPLPAMAALCSNHLARAAERDDAGVFRRAIALSIMLFIPFIFVGLPWFYATGAKELRRTLMSVIPWVVFCGLFLWAGWRCARKRQPRKLMFQMCLFSLMSLLPLAGVFDLMGEIFSVRAAGLYLREELKQGDVLVQYAMNHPSSYFYAGRPAQDSVLIHAAAIPTLTGQKFGDDLYLNRAWMGDKRVFMLIKRRQDILTPLPSTVYNLYDAKDMMVLGNRRDQP